MPAVKTKIIRTMRDRWDEERKIVKKQKESPVFSKQRACGKQARLPAPRAQASGGQAEEGLAKNREYFFDRLALKKTVMDFFPDYEKYLNDAGFSKI